MEASEVLRVHLQRAGGVTTTRELQLLGLTEREVRGAVAGRELVRIRNGAFLAPPVDDAFGVEWHRRMSVAVARQPPDRLALSHESAALLLGLPVLGVPSKVQAVRLSSGRRVTSTALTLREPIPAELMQRLSPPYDDVVVVGPAAAAMQVAARRGGEAGLVVGDGASRLLGLSPEQCFAALAQLGLVKGAEAARLVGGLVSPLSESSGESRCRWLFHRLGLEQPEQQVDFSDGDGFVARVDFLVRRKGVVIEFDGRLKYRGEGTENALWQEKIREDRLRRMGLWVVRITWADLATPSRVRERLASVGLF